MLNRWHNGDPSKQQETLEMSEVGRIFYVDCVRRSQLLYGRRQQQQQQQQ